MSQLRERLERVSAQGRQLLEALRAGEQLDDAAVITWRLNAVSVVSQLVSAKHHYRRELGRIAEERFLAPGRALEHTLGVLDGLRHDVDSGALDDMRGRVRGEVLFDLLDRAEDHYERGYADAAAILLMTILEDRLRSLATINDVPLSRSLEQLSAQLCRAGVYDRAQHEAVQRWNELGQGVVQRSGGAERAEVAAMLDGLARFLDENPAVRKTAPRPWPVSDEPRRDDRDRS